ncbi:hypothetical protein [Corynebacterium falsenii]|uniref:hypothetical protein n=1 Tax=Corynebacterium falsenii TaxID=108486 RepID=UPI003FD0741A
MTRIAEPEMTDSATEIHEHDPAIQTTSWTRPPSPMNMTRPPRFMSRTRQSRPRHEKDPTMIFPPQMFTRDYTIADEANAYIFGDDGALVIPTDNSNRLEDDMLI